MFTCLFLSTGLSDTNGICQVGTYPASTSVSINRDFGQYASIETGAHELGHKSVCC